MDISPRERLVETGLVLFHRDGFHATGIDRILAEALVSKMTLYKYFPSKDALILEVLRRRDERFRAWLRAGVEQRAALPRGRLEALFETLAEWVEGASFHGCLFINATAEYGAAASPVRKAAAEHKALLREWLTDLAREAGAAAPENLAGELLLLKEGLIVSVQVSGTGGDFVETARRMAARAIAAALD